jgi:hypothetical protein
MDTNNNIMDTNTYMNEHQNPSWITRKLWWCAGADEYFLKKSPKQDRVKYAGIGGIVLATGLLAAVSGGFAFYTIFKTKGDANDSAGISWLLGIGVLLFMIIWGTIIFNLDRFIVSSTGKGDGTDSISPKEILQALPRILIALVLGFAISAPLEIKILESEIDGKLQTVQDEYVLELNRNTDKIKNEEINRVKSDISKMEKEINEIEDSFEKRRLEILDQMRQLELEAGGKTGSGIAGRGPAWRDKKENLEKMEAERIDQKKSKEIEIMSKKNRLKASQGELDKIYKSIDEEKVNNRSKAYQLDGLLNRIQISHEIGGMIPWVIFAVFLCIEMGPIFFKMMMTKGPYDYMVENFNHKIQTENGVFKEDKLYEGRNGLIHMETYRYADAEIAKHQVEDKIKSQIEVNSLAVEKAKDKMLKDIKENPDKFIG